MSCKTHEVHGLPSPGSRSKEHRKDRQACERRPLVWMDVQGRDGCFAGGGFVGRLGTKTSRPFGQPCLHRYPLAWDTLFMCDKLAIRSELFGYS